MPALVEAQSSQVVLLDPMEAAEAVEAAEPNVTGLSLSRGQGAAVNTTSTLTPQDTQTAIIIIAEDMSPAIEAAEPRVGPRKSGNYTHGAETIRPLPLHLQEAMLPLNQARAARPLWPQLKPQRGSLICHVGK